MSNPRLHFSINARKSILVPIRTQNKMLDSAFAVGDVLEANVKNYNEYTKMFIADNIKSGEIYWSEDYEYDPTTHTFNFNSLNVCSDEDYEKMSEPCLFDANLSYKTISNTVVSTAIGSGPATNIIESIRQTSPCPDISTGFYIEEKKWLFLTRNIKKRVNTMLIGPTGTGKTDIVQRICNTLGLELNIFDMGSMQDPMTGLLGCRDLVESANGNPVSKFNYSRFVEAIQKPGVVLLDELSRAPREANNILFPCLDNRRKLYVDIAPEGMAHEINVHPECMFIATANIGAEYTGTSEIDAALLNRFLPMQLDYLPADVETKVINIRTTLDITTARKLVNFVNKVRAEYSVGNISKSVSTREILACAELIVDGFSIIDAIDFVITNKYMNNNYNDELTFVKKLIMGF